MTTEAEKLAKQVPLNEQALKVARELDDFNASLDRKAAALLRSQAAEIERLTAEAELFAKHIGLKLARKDALLRECLTVLSASYAEHYDEALELRIEASIKTELGEK